MPTTILRSIVVSIKLSYEKRQKNNAKTRSGY